MPLERTRFKVEHCSTLCDFGRKREDEIHSRQHRNNQLVPIFAHPNQNIRFATEMGDHGLTSKAGFVKLMGPRNEKPTVSVPS
jgi:hypothetical protein